MAHVNWTHMPIPV